GYVPQRERLDSVFPVTVREVVRMGAYRRLRPFAPLPEAAPEVVTHALARVGAQGWQSRLLGELSGGERQRVLIARALVGQTAWSLYGLATPPPGWRKWRAASSGCTTELCGAAPQRKCSHPIGFARCSSPRPRDIDGPSDRDPAPRFSSS